MQAIISSKDQIVPGETFQLKDIFQKNGFNWQRIPNISYAGDNRSYEGNNLYISALNLSYKGSLYELLHSKEDVNMSGRNGWSTHPYIRVTNQIYDLMKKHLHLQGPGSDSLHQHMSMYECNNTDTVRILLNGWGLASIEIWEGKSADLFSFLENNTEQQE